jgi:hypothetical protein
MYATIVTFEFPTGEATTDARPAGHELAQALAQLVREDRECSDPDDEDFGWYLNFEVDGAPTCFVFGYRPDVGVGIWIGKVERDLGFFQSILGRRNKRVSYESRAFVHRLLGRVEGVRNLRWFDEKRFDAGDESAPATAPRRDDE